MEFKPKPDANINETSLRGWQPAAYHELVEAFGEPHCTDGDKSTAEWFFESEDGQVFTLYDYKYEGKGSVPLDNYDWHVGGRGTAIHFINWATGVLEKQRKAAMNETTN